MDYLRTLGSAAVSSLVQKSGLNLPFTLGQRINAYDNKSIWNLYDAVKRDDSSPASVFEFDGTKRNLLPLAKNALRKLRTVRHPDVLKFLDVVETETTIFIMTERVQPLSAALSSWRGKGVVEKEDWLLWGLHRISVALAFVNDAASSTHGNICPNSIFISPSGEWKLGGFELLSNPQDEAAVLYNMGSLLPGTFEHMPPEVRKGGWSALKEHNPAVADAYAFGLLLHAVFNQDQPPPATFNPPHPPPSPSSRGAIPTSVFPSFKRLLNPSPKSRLSTKGFLEIGMAETGTEGAGFFMNNRLVKVCAGLDNFALSSEAEKSTFLRTLKESMSSFPAEFASYKVLPSLVSALEYGGAAATAIIPLVLQIGKNVSPDDYSGIILAPLVKLYASPDRGTRMALLEHLSEYCDKLDKKTVVDKIWPNLQTGFLDTVAVIREATVKSIILLSPKFNERILNNDLLRHLAKMQSDPEPSIRTNTCILMGRLAPSLGYHTKRKVLVPAFVRALRDPFVHARVAGLMAFMASIDCFDIEEIATKVIPNVAGSMIDKEKLVRDQAFKAIELFVKKLEEHAATMPETVIPPEGHAPVPVNGATGIPGHSTLVNSAAGAAGALAGWAINSLGKKVSNADVFDDGANLQLHSLPLPICKPELPQPPWTN
ncbi:ARM repeat-containing protein [Punctularia strigosozonata HHB-11173 SS5]|uniref:ARM repeat-containing protein n=1 Tax=Punctularia strigosozonata (strain HHB-11173) TaxID=741275 RepID=UPI000441789A|nr:ARM repeat-containing protein [Punctularia strigosozonata HHB-11173 SS5]EIN12027.1 ARM repeat-containing protein [Punctularia strigosozonata HHB-11173 SS5]